MLKFENVDAKIENVSLCHSEFFKGRLNDVRFVALAVSQAHLVIKGSYHQDRHFFCQQNSYQES
jgi:hypothetical protein